MRAVRTQGNAEEDVPNHCLSTFGEHFRLTSETFEEMVCKLAEKLLMLPVLGN